MQLNQQRSKVRVHSDSAICKVTREPVLEQGMLSNVIWERIHRSKL